MTQQAKPYRSLRQQASDLVAQLEPESLAYYQLMNALDDYDWAQCDAVSDGAAVARQELRLVVADLSGGAS